MLVYQPFADRASLHVDRVAATNVVMADELGAETNPEMHALDALVRPAIARFCGEGSSRARTAGGPEWRFDPPGRCNQWKPGW